MGNLDLFLHSICLIGQVGGNFSLLSKLDNYFFKKVPIFATVTGTLWAFHLLFDSNAPLLVKGCSVSTLLFFYLKRNFMEMESNIINAMSIQAVLDIAVLELLLLENE